MSTIVYKDGVFAPLEETHISPMDRGYLFGDGVYEVSKVCDGEIFMLEEHLKRLKNSLAGLRFPEMDLSFVEPSTQELMERNKLTKGEVLVYLQITRGAYDPRAHEFPEGEIKPVVFMMISPCPDWPKKGLRIITHKDQRWQLCQYKSLNLLGNVLAKQVAVEKDADEVVLVRDGVALECSASALAIIKGGEVITHPPAEYILPSITIQALKRICESNNIPLVEKPFSVAEVMDADEVLVLNTGRDISQATNLDGKEVGGKDAATLAKLQDGFQALKGNSQNKASA